MVHTDRYPVLAPSLSNKGYYRIYNGEKWITDDLTFSECLKALHESNNRHRS